ncbi:MAG: CopG family transcriptional regulator [Proteobacteria bacterium]|nr:CopG family transcriptional regulator [Pseudomonadota bacterium]
MTERATFSLDKDAFAFLNMTAGKNKSAYINALLLRERQKTLEDIILQANQEEAEDAGYQDELSAWDATLSDGLNG